MPQQYASRKRGEEDAAPLLRGMDDVLKNTYGEIIYQEQCMLIGMKAFGFNSNQSDSLIRKILAKKKKEKMEMLRRMIKFGKVNTEGPNGWKDNPNLPWYDLNGKEYGDEISGALKNGYSPEEIDTFWNILIGFADYCFNKSHALSYSIISYTTAWLKYYYPVEFYASVLSSQENDDKKAKYIGVCENEGIQVTTPNVNISEENFTPDSKNKKIYYGLSSIKGVGEAAYKEIIKVRPYSSLEDLFTKLPKKILNKRVVLALAKSGALDDFEENKNRYALINKIMQLRKEKSFEELNENAYIPATCIEFEEEVLSTPITFKPWWNTVKANETIKNESALIITKRELTDKNGNLMAFVTLNIKSCIIEAVVFASTYSKNIGFFDDKINISKKIAVSGKKDEKCKLIVNKVTEDFFNI